MNAAKKLIDEVARHGGRLVLTADGGLKVQAPAPLPDDLTARLREHKAELLRGLPDESEKAGAGQAPRQPDTAQAPAGERSSTSNQDSNRDRTGLVLHTNYGAGHPDAKPQEPMPAAALAWPQALSVTLNRVATHFEWTSADWQDFIQWARRSPEALADARAFLEAEAAKLPKPDQSEQT